MKKGDNISYIRQGSIDENHRHLMGEKLKELRESKGKSRYAVARDGGISVTQVTAIEKGDKNYTIDVFTGYVRGVGLCMYFAEEENDLAGLTESSNPPR
jgi:transcriptional regulator with XRE-family HTH domain